MGHKGPRVSVNTSWLAIPFGHIKTLHTHLNRKRQEEVRILKK